MWGYLDETVALNDFAPPESEQVISHVARFPTSLATAVLIALHLVAIFKQEIQVKYVYRSYK